MPYARTRARTRTRTRARLHVVRDNAVETVSHVFGVFDYKALSLGERKPVVSSSTEVGPRKNK